MSDELREHITDSNIWLRLVFMLLFAVIFGATRLILVCVIAVQFLWVLFSGNKNEQLLSFASQLATFLYQTYRYLSFNTEKRPFPFAEWPSDAPLLDDAMPEAEVVEETPAAQPADKQEPEISKPAEEEAVEPEVVENDAVDAASESGIESEEKPAEPDAGTGSEEKKD